MKYICTVLNKLADFLIYFKKLLPTWRSLIFSLKDKKKILINYFYLLFSKVLKFYTIRFVSNANLYLIHIVKNNNIKY